MITLQVVGLEVTLDNRVASSSVVVEGEAVAGVGLNVSIEGAGVWEARLECCWNGSQCWIASA